MNPTSAPHLCPVCHAPLEGGGAAEFCPACMWREFTAEETTGRPAPAADALFAVAGHDVLAEIARGGGGIVYRARQREPRREVALKMLLPHQTSSTEMHDRFRLETDAIAGLEHRTILPVYLVGEHRGMPFFTMKLATGGTLAERRDALRGDWRAIADLVATLADAVQFAHARGVIHRDLKPGNVLFDEAGVPYVSDFGLAKFLDFDAHVTRTLTTFGTPAYLAPEIAVRGAAAATTTTDIYGLGAILYELLAGRPPFVAESLPALLRSIAEETPPPIRPAGTKVPPDLEVIALRCLAKDPARRFGSAGELAADLRRWLEGRPVLSRPVAAGERLASWARRNPALALSSALLVLSLLSGIALVLDGNASLRRTSTRALAAERTAREQLQASLISEARLTRRSHRADRRSAALARLDQAAAIGPLDQLRSEYIATLAHPDLTVDRRMPTAHARSDYTVDFSSDLKRYLVADPAGGFVEREAATGEVTRRFVAPGPAVEIWYLNYAPGDAGVLVSYRDGRTEYWAGRGTAPAWSGAGLYGGDSQPMPVAPHPAGRQLARVAADDSVRAIDLTTGAEETVLAPAGEVRLLSFDPSGRVLLVVHRNRAEAWSWPEARRLWTMPGPMSPARPAWSPDSRRVAVGLTGRDDIAVIDAASGRVERRIAAHNNDARLLAFHPGGRLLASVGWDGQLALHDIQTGQLELQREAWVRTLRFSGDGRRLAFSFNHIEVATADFAAVECLRELGDEPEDDGSSCRLAVSPDGRWVASTDYDELRLWDARSGRLVDRRAAPTRPEASSERDWATVMFEGKGGAVIEGRRYTGLRHSPLVFSGDGSVRLGPAEAIAPGRPGELLRIDPRNGDWWLQRFATSELLVWPGGRPAAERRVLQAPALDGPGLSPDGRFISRRRYPEAGMQILDATTGREVASIPTAQTLSASFSPDGAWLLTGTGGEYRLWHTGDWQPGPAWPARVEGGSYGGGYYSPDGRILAVLQGRGTLELRETRGYGLLLQLEMPQDMWMHHFAWAPDGGGIYALCVGHRVLYWDLQVIRRELKTRGLDWE